jgi:septal ring factor EnvC (AmiA/AmiB activator)
VKEARLEEEREAKFEQKCQESFDRLDSIEGSIRAQRMMIEADKSQLSTVSIGPDAEFTREFQTHIRERQTAVKRLEAEWQDESKRFTQLIAAFQSRFGRPAKCTIR